MFSKQGVFTRDQLDECQDCTFFRHHAALQALLRAQPSEDPEQHAGKSAFHDHSQLRRDREDPRAPRESLPLPHLPSVLRGWLREPHVRRLPMFSVFSEMAPLQLKLKYAFRIYDYDGDDQLGHDDLSKMIRCLTRHELSDEEVEFIIERIIEEADLDGDEQISYAEFEHVVSRSPDFIRTFHIRI
ncbi:hypothetical protein L596_029248 [Steinernema carpocapsae]|uniref:EF-hand domain-containing protein n=1 Tax=Steinernema carpocapsae TaxID=34508 RepID=A0A4U5LU33_STECR|nr:hypothetical protein L596_029248 [Steinernema carpocapsae]